MVKFSNLSEVDDIANPTTCETRFGTVSVRAARVATVLQQLSYDHDGALADLPKHIRAGLAATLRDLADVLDG